VDSLPNAFALELCKAAQDAQHEPSSGAARVDAFADGREAYACISQRLDGDYQVSEAPAEPIQLPAHDDIQLSALRVRHELVESWPPVLRTADTAVDVFGWLPAARLAVAAQLQQLVLARLVAGRHASVECRTSCSHVVGVFSPGGGAIANPIGHVTMLGGFVQRGLT